ncbi:DNA primase [Sphingomonas montana]|uniref:DNA primase n=1 Tax=Sphingomonas montana TaxID=1843236 RepID=UPI00096E4CA6|nr:DNA primase [Sphingomonas montana]
MSLTPQWLDELRARTTLSTLIGRTVKLQKAGREYRACCPFHQEKSPSFYVNDEKGFYHCFGCSAHGDAIKYLTEAQGLPFMDAVKELAATAGMEVPANDPRAAERQARAVGLHDVMAAAAAWFTEQLATPEAAHARAYLAKRGVTEHQGKAFGFGFAPDGRNRLKAALASFGVPMLVEAGLLIQVEDKDPYDRFRGRLMIPIRDQRGRPMAFGGRILGDGEPKYLNSPETPLFDKGRTLFNIDRAAAAARKAGRVVVVEGYMDVVALDRAGIGEGVAPLGTALTESQMERLWKMADVPILCFDGDSAGQKAAARAAVRALPLIQPGRTLRFATLPAGQDPDDLLASGGRSALDAVLDTAEPLSARLWALEVAAAPLDTPEARAGLRRRLADHAATIADRDVREQYQADFRERFDALFQRAPRQNGFTNGFTPGRPSQRGTWKPGRGFVPPSRPLTDTARSIGSDGVTQRVVSAILTGILRHPSVLHGHAEALAALPIHDHRLRAIRDAMVDAAFDPAALESGGLALILQDGGHEAVSGELIRTNGLAFSFLRGNADPDRAMRDLGAVIDAVVERAELEAALDRATDRFKANPDDEAAFAEQLRLGAARNAAAETLATLVADQDGLGN